MWLAWLFITAHLIIPHDHHLSNSFTAKEGTCPVSNGKTGHGSGFPMHCQALNDLTSLKATTCLFPEKIRVKNIAINSFFDQFVFEFLFSDSSLTDFCESFSGSNLLELSSLRAPPSLI